MFSFDFNILLFMMTRYDCAFPSMNIPFSVLLLGHSFVNAGVTLLRSFYARIVSLQ